MTERIESAGIHYCYTYHGVQVSEISLCSCNRTVFLLQFFFDLHVRGFFELVSLTNSLNGRTRECDRDRGWILEPFLKCHWIREEINVKTPKAVKKFSQDIMYLGLKQQVYAHFLDHQFFALGASGRPFVFGPELAGAKEDIGPN
jgi:hypothetical protein